MSELTSLIKKRRSIRVLADGSPIDDQALELLVKDLVNYLPTAFDIQNSCLALLLGNANKALWNEIVLPALRAKAKPESFAKTEQKIAGFAGGHGTVLFFNNEQLADQLRQNMPRYADNVSSWQLQHNGMLQLAAWLLFCEQGYGASLQHYNPLIDDAVRKRWELPQSWSLLAQMPFGIKAEEPGEKQINSISERMRVFTA